MKLVPQKGLIGEAALREARLQIEYLDAKFQPTGTSAAVLARIEATIKNATERT